MIRGEDWAVRAFVDRLGPVVLGVFRGYRGLDGSTADDLFQQVFVKLAEDGHRRLRGFRGDASLKTWLTTVCLRTALDHLRANHRRREAVDTPVGEHPETSIDDIPGDCDTRAEAGAAELRVQLGRALALVPDAYRKVLELSYWHDLDYREIAARTGDSVTNVGVKLSRGRAMLRRIVVSEFPELPLHLDDE